MIKQALLYPMLLLVSLVIMPASAFAVAQVSIAPGGDGVFVLQGTGMQGVAGIQIAISYDSSTLSAPQVTLGNLVGERFNGINTTSNPIRIAVVDTVNFGGSGSGTIATITFTRNGTSPGLIDKLDATLIDQNRNKVAMGTPLITNPASDQTTVDGSTTTATSTNATTTGGTATTTSAGTTTMPPFVVGGTLTFPPTETAVKEKTEAPTAPQENTERQALAREAAAQSSQAGEDKALAPKAAVPPASTPQPAQSVLEKFRLFQGERTVKNLSALFVKDSAGAFVQSPAIAIADGKAIVALTISKVGGDKAPNFAFNFARYVSLTRVADGEWEIVVRPDAGAVRASVSMLSNGAFQDFPLVVTPKAEVLLAKSGEVSEADFLLFLKETGTAAAPRYDLNGDGRRDYLDDYIFTANYLLKMEERAEKMKSAQQQPKQ